MTLQAAVMMSDLNKLKIMNKDTSLMFQRTLLLDFGELWCAVSLLQAFCRH